jgi:serine/threonine-protein kinase RsbW
MTDSKSATFPGRVESLSDIGTFIAEAAQAAGFDEMKVYRIQLAVDEACSNIIEHAYGGEGEGEIECTCSIRETGLTIILRDFGAPFNPNRIPQPDLGAPLEERTAGGLGLYLMYQIMDTVQFEFDESGNTLILEKRKEPSE